MTKRGRPRRDSSNESQKSLYDAGYIAFCVSKKLTDCRYTIDSKAGKHWRAGWYQALHDDKKTNPILISIQTGA